MNPNEAELVTITSHLPDGRIHQFVKTPIRLAEAEQMKVKARLEAEEFRAKTLLQSTDAVLASVEKPAPAPAPAARPAPQQRAIPRAPAVMARAEGDPVDAVVPARDAVVPAHVVAADKKRKEKQEQLAALRREHEAFKAEALAFFSKKTREIATYVGTGVGRAFMQKAIDSIPADTPPTAKVSVDGTSIEAAMQSTYKQLVEAKYCPTVKTKQFAQTFVEAFMVGVRETAAKFESTPRQYPARQATDAGDATQDASV
jgi:hypothetical protein